VHWMILPSASADLGHKFHALSVLLTGYAVLLVGCDELFGV